MHFFCAYKLFLIFFPQSCPQYQYESTSSILDIINTFLMSNVNPDEVTVPETAKNPFVYLEEHNYYYENHTITTEDGYILMTVRIPYGKKRISNNNRPPVIFVHGIYCTFYDFLSAGPDNAIGFLILEEGYDIWLINARGNTFSRKHITLDPVLNASAYWNFSWHEIAFYDVPANMDYVENVTGFTNVSIVGHSQGGTIFFAFAASRPEYEKRVTFSIQLAPVMYTRHAKQLVFHTLAENLDVFDRLVRKFKLRESLPSNELYLQFVHACSFKSPLIPVCGSFLEFLGGPSNQINGSLLATLISSHPAGASAKQVVHFFQITVSDKFRQYDYGPDYNKIAYNQETPPMYNISAITAPVAIYYGNTDFFVSLIDGAKMVSQIPSALPFLLPETNHLDVQWGSRAVENIFRPAIKLLNKYNKHQVN